jgi:murein DD-endopeptidase MepM/ murein hydrolase activator NlpD
LYSVKRIFVIFLVIILVGIDLPAFSASTVNVAGTHMDKKKIETKIKELKTKEKIEIKKLTKNQQNLEKTKESIMTCQNKLEISKNNVENLQIELGKLQLENNATAEKAGKRIREIYKGERVNLVELLIESKDLGTFLDRLYYQKKILKRDKDLMTILNIKANRVLRSKRMVEREKRSIASTLEIMKAQKNQLSSSIESSQFLLNKLRTDRASYEQAQKELEALSRNIENDIRRVSSDNITSDGVFLTPLIGAITSGFGWRVHPIFRSRRFHTGVDISGSCSAAIKASNSGKVIYSGWYGGYGKVVIVNHGVISNGNIKGNKISTLYAHLNSATVSVGDVVKKGQVVGYQGTTGYSTGPHLHFEVRIDGRPTNPLNYIR